MTRFKQDTSRRCSLGRPCRRRNVRTGRRIDVLDQSDDRRAGDTSSRSRSNACAAAAARRDGQIRDGAVRLDVHAPDHGDAQERSAQHHEHDRGRGRVRAGEERPRAGDRHRRHARPRRFHRRPISTPSSKDGQIWGLPDWALHQEVWYRKDLFEQAGLKVPRSWDELLQAAKTLNAAGRRRQACAIRLCRADGPLARRAADLFPGLLFGRRHDLRSEDRRLCLRRPESARDQARSPS